MFRRAGYRTTFFSNQDTPKGKNRRFTNLSTNFFLADNELSDTLFDYRNTRYAKYDLELIQQYETFTNSQKPSTYTLDIIHLIGQHFTYSERYSSDNQVFTLDDYEYRKLNDDAKKIVMHYDNATAYNDIVLDSLLTLLESQDAIVIHLSDHGEEVYDETQTSGRLFKQPTPTTARYEFEVPMWIWLSPSYKKKHPEIAASVQSATHKPFITDALPQLLLFLAGIQCSWYNDERNILSPHYKPSKRIISGDTDYDKIMSQETTSSNNKKDRERK